MTDGFTAFFLNFLVAIAVGALIGLEREHRRDQTPVIAGVRTFPLFSVSGYMLAIIANAIGDPGIPQAILLATGVGGIVAVAIAFLRVRHELGLTGLTTPMAMVVTFLLGVLIGYEFVQQAIVVGVATTFLLLTKERLHTFAEILNDEEMMGALQFITVAFILFPLVATLEPPVLGQSWIGRDALIDPYFTLLIVIFVSAISFASFLAMRAVGARRGVTVSGLLGGLVNSEATSVSLAQQATEEPDLVRAAGTGAILSTTTMFVRNLAIAAFADPSLALLNGMFWPLVAMALVGGALATWRYMKQMQETHQIQPPRIRNPFALGPAVKFAALFLALNVLAVAAQELLGVWGVYATAVGGFVSAGAVVASVASLTVTGVIPVKTAVEVAVLATVIGTGNKLFLLRAANPDVYGTARLPFLALTVVGLLALAAVIVLL